MFTRRSFVVLLLVGLLIAANLGAVTKVKGDEQNQLDSALTSVSFQLPFHGRKYILQGPWGNCTQVVCREAETHRCRGTCPCPVWEAIDFDIEYEDVFAAESGVVDFAGLSDWAAYGNLVRIKHDNGFISYYAHLSNWDRNFVAGQTRVAKGQWLGVSGMSGTDNTHLHFEVRDASNNAVLVRDIPGMHWHSGDPNNPCGVKQGAYFGYGDGPTCNCTAWENRGCGEGCDPGYRRQVRTCTLFGCDSERRCVRDTSCDPQPTQPDVRQASDLTVPGKAYTDGQIRCEVQIKNFGGGPVTIDEIFTLGNASSSCGSPEWKNWGGGVIFKPFGFKNNSF